MRREEWLRCGEYRKDEDLRNKIASFRESTGTNKSIQLVMVTTYGVKENKYSGIVGNQVLLDDLFKE